MSSFLPQSDPNPERRERVLNSRQDDYQYNYTYVSPLAMVERVPLRDQFSLKWLHEVVKRVLTVIANHIEYEGDPARLADEHKYHSLIREIGESATTDARGLVRSVRAAIDREARCIRPKSLDDYADLFRKIGLPAIHRDFRDDRVFADMRVAGPNPLMIQRVRRLDDRFPVTEAHFHRALPNDSLAAAADEGRLYLADFALLNVLEPGNFPCGNKYAYAPLALFAVNKQSRELVPVAIQCGQTPGPEMPIFTKDDGYNWLIAKTIVEIADGNVHEAVSHLGRTHLFVEPFVIATYRRLGKNHPLGRLLRPHFEGTLAINDAAQAYLIAPQGGVDKLTCGTIESTRTLVVKGLEDYLFNHAMLPLSLKARGVDDKELLPNYPFRDDAMLYWDAIHTWVTDYLTIYYPSDADVAQDVELKTWFEELIANDGGRVRGLGLNGALATRAYLADVATLIIYTGSVQHAAVNFPQYDLMSYTLNMPLAGYAPPPKSKTGATEQDFLNLLPPLDMALMQLDLGYILGTVHYTQLGHYRSCYFRNPRTMLPLAKFAKQLKQIGDTITERNQTRRRYDFLLPGGIPQSINI